MLILSYVIVVQQVDNI